MLARSFRTVPVRRAQVARRPVQSARAARPQLFTRNHWRSYSTSAPKDLLYTKSHEWIKVEGNIGTIGITDVAARELGDIVFVDLPAVGKQAKKGSSILAVESVKAAADVYTPVTAEVTEVNEALKDKPESVNQSPFTDGWMVKVKISDPTELKDLLTAEQYAAEVNAATK